MKTLITLIALLALSMSAQTNLLHYEVVESSGLLPVGTQFVRVDVPYNPIRFEFGGTNYVYVESTVHTYGSKTEYTLFTGLCETLRYRPGQTTNEFLTNLESVWNRTEVRISRNGTQVLWAESTESFWRYRLTNGVDDIVLQGK